MQLIEIYLERKNEFLQKSEEQSSKYNKFSILRLIYFVGGIFLLIFLFQQNLMLGGLATLLFITGAASFIRWHGKIKELQNHYSHMSTINDLELRGQKNDFTRFHNGDEFIDVNHPYSYDLDFFGDHSLFQYCNRTVTSMGRSTLSQIFSQSAETKTILQHQEAAKELSQKLEWRQNFQALGFELSDHPAHINILKKWLEDEPIIINNKLNNWARFIVPIISCIGLVLAFYIPLVLAILFFVPALIVLKSNVEKINEVHLRTTHTEKALSRYAALIKHIEDEDFNSELLRKFKSKIEAQNSEASKKIKRLSYIISQLNVRYNVFAIILNLIGLWDLQWVAKLEYWKEKHKSNLPEWFEVLKEFDALISLGTLDYNHPDWVYPSIHELSELHGKDIGHPLIDAAHRVDNDFSMPTNAHIKLVTGSNMAGKSTFLRTVAINIVLALSGAKVCAKEFKLPQLAVYTSMRTTDALHESTSSFYAELKRLKIILDAVDRKEQVYFLLDEILKGTNSKDRHTGSKALIEQLIVSGGAGIIATHDLDLHVLEDKYDGKLENLCMEVEVVDDQLDFDYKLKKGVSQSFNATTLMRNMGIKIAKDL